MKCSIGEFNNFLGFSSIRLDKFFDIQRHHDKKW